MSTRIVAYRFGPEAPWEYLGSVATDDVAGYARGNGYYEVLTDDAIVAMSGTQRAVRGPIWVWCFHVMAYTVVFFCVTVPGAIKGLFKRNG